MATDLKTQILNACDTAETFTTLFYESLDKRRHIVDRLYMDTATLVFNGTGQSGTDKIKQFYQELPPSEHRLHSFDSQPVVDNAVSGQTTLLIQCSGMVKFDNAAERPFQQSFMVTAQGDKWKIFSDVYRIQDELFK